MLTLENYRRLLGEKNYRIKNIFLKIFFLLKLIFSQNLILHATNRTVKVYLLKEFSRAFFFVFVFVFGREWGREREREREVGCHY